MARELNKCIFCGASPTTWEHVFSRWTHKYLSPRVKGRAKSSIGREYPDRTITKLVKLPGQMRDWQIKCVCGGTHLTCNGGWMREIENASKPVLTPLITGKPVRLTPFDQKIIATWAVLKSIISEQGELTPKTVQYKHKKYIMKHASPPVRGWGVWIGHFDRIDWIPEMVSRQALLLPNKLAERRASREATYFNSNATTQVVGKLFIHVMHSPMPNLVTRWRFHLPQGGTLFRIWPPAATSINWPGRPLTDIDADSASDQFAAFVMNVARNRIAETS